MPAADATAIHAAIPGSASDGQAGFTLPCTTSSSIEFTFGGQNFAIDPRDLAFLPLDPNDLQGDCQSGICEYISSIFFTYDASRPRRVQVYIA